jgi:hypothetical protein
MKDFKKMFGKQSIGRLPLLVVFSAITLTACVTNPQRQPLYYWGDFQDQQYTYFKGEKGPEEGILALEKIREEASSKGRNVPPGLMAQLGIFYGMTGRMDRFEEDLQAEKRLFPESSTYVNFLLKKKQEQ